MQTIQERITAQIEFGEGGCWLWRGATTPSGYGRMKAEGKMRMVTHLALEAEGKFKPSIKYQACHRCDVPRCVNPEHLYWGTVLQNHKDTVSRGRHKEASKTHCPSGHEYTPENIHRTTEGHRVCRVCKKMHAVKSYRKRVQREEPVEESAERRTHPH